MISSAKVLIQCGDHFENQSRILTLARALKEGGHQPVVMLYAKGKGRVFRNEGIETVSYKEFEAEAKGNPTLKTELEPGLLIETLARLEGQRRPSVLWPGQLKKTANDISRYHGALAKILLGVNPDIVVIWNGYTGYVANLLREMCASRKLKVAFVERGLLKGSLFIDAEGVNGGSSLRHLSPEQIDASNTSSKDLSIVAELFGDSQIADVSRKNSAQPLRILFPLQVQLDTNIVMYSKYTSMREVFLEALSRFKPLNIEFLIRPHPEELSSTPINIPRYSNVRVSSSETLEHWIDWADVVLTVNSTVGLEALVRGKNVIALGESIYSSAGLTSAFSAEGLTSGPPNHKRVKKYLHTLLSRNLLLSGGTYNSAILAKQLEISMDGPVHVSGIAESSTIRGEAADLEEVDVIVDCSLNEPLDLTYRKNKERLTRDWLLGIAATAMPAKKYNVLRAKDPKRGAIKTLRIVDELFEGPADDLFSKTIDVYGIIVQ